MTTLLIDAETVGMYVKNIGVLIIRIGFLGPIIL